VVNSLFLTSHRSWHPLILQEWLLSGGVEALVPFGQVLVRALTYRMTSIPEVNKEEQEQQVVLSWPSSSATTTVVGCQWGSPILKGNGAGP
jgi:hypothetical protein